MPSVLEQVFAAMPLVCARLKIRGNTLDWACGDAAELAQYVRVDLPTASLDAAKVKAPAVSDAKAAAASEDGNVPDIALWSYEPSAEPSRIDNLSCLVHGDRYREYLVLESLRFGNVRVVRGKASVTLPLTKDYLFAVLRTEPMTESERPGSLFPLAASYDRALVYAFVFDVPFLVEAEDDPQGAPLPETQMTLAPLPVKTTDPAGWSVLMKALEEFQQVESAGSDGESESAGSRSSTIREVLFQDDLWNPIDDKHWAEVNGDPADIRVVPARVLVLASLTPCREKDDFTPRGPFGGMVGLARLYPHVLVKATFPLDVIVTGLEVKRPERTTIRDGKPCGCDEMGDEIAPLLITDINEPDTEIDPPPPHWEAIFSYFQVNAHEKFAQAPIRLIDPQKERRKVFGARYRNRPSYSTEVTKYAGQGAFDNLHLAPKMQLPQSVAGYGRLPISVLGPGGFGPVTLVTHTLDELRQAGWEEALRDIVMAPVCAHDCFHAHWRWTDKDGVNRAVHGWDETAPHRVPGAPMVPLHHTVDLVIESAHTFRIIERACHSDRKQGRKTAKGGPMWISADTWEVFHHPGYAYATWADTASMKNVARLGTDFYNLAESGGGSFVDKDGRPVTARTSWAVFYFFLRYSVSPWTLGVPGLQERIQLVVPIEELMK